MGSWLRTVVAGAAQTGGVIGAVVAFGLIWAGCGARWEAHAPYNPRPMEQKARWLVDGFNVLHAGVLRGNDRSGWWREEMRARLLERVAAFEDGAAELWYNAATEDMLLNGFLGIPSNCNPTVPFPAGCFIPPVPPLVHDAQFFTPVPAEQFTAGSKRSYSRTFDLGPGDLETWSIDGALEYNMEGLPLLGDVDLFVLGGYGEIDNEGLSDSDATTYGALDTESAQVPETKGTFEIRLQSNNESWLNWTLGFFYVKNDVDQVRNTFTPLTISGATLQQLDTGYAPFANVTLKPIDPIEIFLGVRWNHDEFERHEVSNPTPLTPSTDFRGGDSWRETTLG